ncbi:MAG: hypothetical protein GX039_05835, partial [Clostridia bacterium]|nr:hypothetical protein [Clostridia bacterium]
GYVMGLKPLEGAKVVAGHHCLNRKVTGVTVMEAPDIVQWLRGGEILLTSLYPIRGDREAQENLVRELMEHNAAALVIKTRRFVGDIPSHMLKLADNLGLPVIDLPMEISYVDVISAVLSEIIDQQTVRLRYSEKVHDYFTSIALKGGTLEQLAFGLAELVNNPVIIKDHRDEYLVKTNTDYQVVDRDDKAAEQQYLNEELHYYRQPLSLESNGEKIICSEVVVPIVMQKELYGYLTVWEVNQLMQDYDFIALEHAATVVALELAKRRAVTEVERKYQNDFINDLLEGRIENEETVYNRARFLGWDLSKPMAVIVANIDNFEEYMLKNKHKGERFAQKIKAQALEAITRYLGKQAPGVAFGSKSDTLILLYPVRNGDTNDALAEVKRLCRLTQKEVGCYLKDLTFSMGIGSLAGEITELCTSYQEALDALRFGRIVNGRGSVTVFSELGIFRLLCQVPDRNILLSFIPESLKKLIRYDQKNKTELARTLEVYLDNNGSLKKSAEQLIVHYKTMFYRIERIREITGLDLESNITRLELQVGYKVLQLLDMELNKVDKIDVSRLNYVDKREIIQA